MNSEKDIKRKFDKRKIDPSPQAWEKVTAGLDKKDKSKLKNYMSIFAVAAGFIGLVIVSNWYLWETERPSVISNKASSQPTVVTTKSKSADSVAGTINALSHQESLKKQTEPILNKSLVMHDSETDLDISEEVKIASQEESISSEEPEIEEAIDDQVARLLAEVAEAEEEGSTISNKAIDSLLARAQSRITKRFRPGDAQKFSAIALLEDVEHELDQSFRARVFDALKSGFEKAREAIAARNK